MNAKLSDRFFVSSCDGGLYRREHRGLSSVIRPNYCRTHARINTVADFKATLRAGAYAWPGGYPLYFITSDGCALSFESARKKFRSIAYAIKHRQSDGWKVEACEVNWEDPDLRCEHSGERIESAYAEDREVQS